MHSGAFPGLQAARQAQLGASWAPLGHPIRTPSASWTPLGLNLALQAALQVQLGASWLDLWCSCYPQNRALASTRAQFSWFRHFCSPSALGLQFHTCLASTWISWTPLGLNLEPLGRLLGSTWSLLGASWAQLRDSWAPLGFTLESLGRLLGSTWSPWAPLGLNLEALGRFLGATWTSWMPRGFNLEPLGRQVGLRTAVCVALPCLCGAKLGSVQPFVQLSLASWAPSWALYCRLCGSPWLLGAKSCPVHTFVQLSLAS